MTIASQNTESVDYRIVAHRDYPIKLTTVGETLKETYALFFGNQCVR